MLTTKRIPAEAADATSRYLALAAAEGVTPFGLYLVGSVALDDFQPGGSDVDFLALFPQPLETSQTRALARIHAAMAQAGGPCFDGLYLTPGMLRAPPPPMSVAPFVVEGVFKTDAPCGELTPAVFDCLRQSGVRIGGPPVGTLDIAGDRVETARFLRGNLASYWSSWGDRVEAALAAKAPGDPVSARVMSDGVLGVSRIAATLATGRIVSKSAAGAWALSLADDPEDAVTRALAVRRGEIDRLSIPEAREALAYVRRIVAKETAGLTP